MLRRNPLPALFPILLLTLAVPLVGAEDGKQRLAEADRLAMLYNWPRALPLYADAEREFLRLNDPKGVLEARLGWIRAQANATPSPALAHVCSRHR